MDGPSQNPADEVLETLMRVAMHALCRLAVDQPEVFTERAQWCLDNHECVLSTLTEGDIVTVMWASRPLVYVSLPPLLLGSDLYIQTLPPVPDDPRELMG